MSFNHLNKNQSLKKSGGKRTNEDMLDQTKNSEEEKYASDSSQYSGLAETSEEDSDSSKDHDDDQDESSEFPKYLEKEDEYHVDSSDEEDLRNTVGNIPIEWYKDFPHIGYDWDGKKIMKPLQGDELDDFLKKMDDPNYWKTVKDKMTGQDVILSDEDLSLIQRIQKGKYPVDGINQYELFEDIYSHETMIHPVTNRPEHKRSFIPSKVEKEKVSRMVYAIKMGWIKPRVLKKDDTPKYYMLWDNDAQAEISKHMLHHIPAPKMKLPGHEESYNPPPEYLFTKKEEDDFCEKEPEERKITFVPKKYSCLRLVPAYADYIKERFERCLDLYLCPRQRKMRVNVDPEDLIPKLPKPKDLQPFPTTQALVYIGHKDAVRCITVEPMGQFLASGSSDCTVHVWEVLTGRCMKTFAFDSPIKALSWCPSRTISLLAVAVGRKVFLVNPGVGDRLKTSDTDNILKVLPESNADDKKCPVVWTVASEKEQIKGQRLIVTHEKEVKKVTWHGKGDYFATVVMDAGNNSVIIHHLSTKSSQVPFRKMQGDVQCVLFHPTRPYFFVASQRHVRVYNLLKQQLTKKLLTNCKWLSSMDLHPQGDNLIIGSYDTKLTWFDLDLSVKPYKTIRHHRKAIRQVSFHKHYPLLASASDDGTIIVCHGMVYSDLLQNPLIVPVKVLKGHQVTNDLGVLDCTFHPFHPWIFSAGADSTIRLFT